MPLTSCGFLCYGPSWVGTAHLFGRVTNEISSPTSIGIRAFFRASGWVKAQTLRVPYVSLSPTAGPLWIAYEAGFFKRNNVSTELLYIPGGSTIIQAIISGDVKIANMAPPSAIGAWAKGFHLILIASGVDQLLETVVIGPAIQSPADLKNKKIGVSRFGSLTDMALREALRHYKLNPYKDVTVLQTGGEATRFAALTSGAIDGAMLSGDKMVQAEKMGFRVTIDLSKLPICPSTFPPAGKTKYSLWIRFVSIAPA
jgi:ABC-type nitrate/sulfonate/bicarbonate transport system substrate-binding protein